MGLSIISKADLAVSPTLCIIESDNKENAPCILALLKQGLISAAAPALFRKDDSPFLSSCFL